MKISVMVLLMSVLLLGAFGVRIFTGVFVLSLWGSEIPKLVGILMEIALAAVAAKVVWMFHNEHYTF